MSHNTEPQQLQSAQQTTVHCWIHNQEVNVRDVLSVRILNTGIVADLKEAIKASREDLSKAKLEFYSIPYPYPPHFADTLQKWNLVGQEPLHDPSKLSALDPSDKLIIVRAFGIEISVRYCIYPISPKRTFFSVNILNTKFVTHLEEAIRAKEPGLSDTTLELYSIPYASRALDTLRNWNPVDQEPLHGLDELSTLDLSDKIIIVRAIGIEISVHCCVYPTGTGSIFSVPISDAQNVSGLKTVIMATTAQGFHGPDEFDLYAVPLEYSEHLRLPPRLKALDDNPVPDIDVLMTTLRNWTPSKEYFLSPFLDLYGLDLTHKLIIIVRSNFEMKISCYVRRESVNPNTIFTVSVSNTQEVIDLRNAIKAAKQAEFRNIDPDWLALYKVSLKNDEDLSQRLKDIKLTSETFLKPHDNLGQVFSGFPSQDHLVIIEAPLPKGNLLLSLSSLPLQDVCTQRHEFLTRSRPLPPSTGGKAGIYSSRQNSEGRTIYCGRPPRAVAKVPAVLLHPVFGQFLHDCETLEVTPEDEVFALELSAGMSEFYADEKTRAMAIQHILDNHGLKFIVTKTPHGYETDGSMHVNGHCYAIAEFKNEVGSTGAEPYLQAGLYFIEATRSTAPQVQSPLPCMLLLLFGPYIVFAAAAWNVRPTLQPLSRPLSMYNHPTDIDIRLITARHLGAFRKAIRNLKEYYENFSEVATPRLNLQFPYPTSFFSIQKGRKQCFRYLSQPFENKLVFFGETINNEAEDQGVETEICVKFVRRYSREAHEVCQEMGVAPTLRGYETISGGWLMVIMDKVPEDAYELLYRIRVPLSPNSEVFDKIKKAIEKFHQRGFVHGDVRDTNIMVSRVGSKFMLLDFDWAGKIGEVRYPVDINKDLFPPEDIKGCGVMKADHDIDMLDTIIHGAAQARDSLRSSWDP